MSRAPSIITLGDHAELDRRRLAVVSAPTIAALVEASSAAVEQGFYVRVDTDRALGESDPIALFSVLAAGGAAEVETVFTRQAERCAAMNRAISSGRP